MEKIMPLGEIFFSSSRFSFVLCGEIINGFVKFETSELVSIINPFNSITAIMLVELSSPSSVMKSLFLSENKLIDKEIITIKLAKLDEFVDDLYRSTTSESNAKLFPPENSFFKIKEILVELNNLNN